MRVWKAVACAAALTAFLAPGIRADEFNKKTILTFSGPVQIPGATLAAGTYVFKLADLTGNRHVVQVFDKDEKHIYGTLLAIPNQRLEPADNPVVLFGERPAGTPQAVKVWFYPGETIGNEFVYPKNQAMQIAKATHQSVLAMDEQTSANTTDDERMNSMKSAKVTRVDENGTATDEASMNQTQSQAVGTSGSTTQSSTNQSQSPSPSQSRSPAASQNKPATTTTGSATTTSGAATTTSGAAKSGAATTAGASSTPSATTTASSDAKLKNGSGRAARDRNNAQVGTTGQASTNTADNTNNTAKKNGRRHLPRTASSLALFELLSGLTLAGGFGVRTLRVRLANAR